MHARDQLRVALLIGLSGPIAVPADRRLDRALSPLGKSQCPGYRLILKPIFIEVGPLIKVKLVKSTVVALARVAMPTAAYAVSVSSNDGSGALRVERWGVL
jgi:hypothetical protein